MIVNFTLIIESNVLNTLLPEDTFTTEPSTNRTLLANSYLT